MNFTTDIVVGLEVHVELNTNTKLFCACSRLGDETPNTRTCPTCLGHPGTRPVLNKAVVDKAIKLCLAVGSEIDQKVVFSRKSYFYPDMSKNFQITQFEEPIGTRGAVKLKNGKDIILKRIHIEEDPASITYPGSLAASQYSLLDYNRAGNPLLEVVTEPVMGSPAEARDFLNQLIKVLSYLEIFEIENCIIKADANISLKESNYTRVEIKNITGFKELERALHYEVTRQRTYLRRGLKIKQETRAWDDVSRTTKSMRTKETEADYGYILEPDIPIIPVVEKQVHYLKQQIPELAHQKADRYKKTMSLDPDDADILSTERELAELFEKIAAKIDPKLAARWLRRELLRVLNYNKKSIKDIQFDEQHVIELLELVDKKEISDTTAQKLMEQLMEQPFPVKEYVQKNNLQQVSGDGIIREAVKQILNENEKALQDYRAGEEKAFQFLVGQVMRLTKGKAEPSLTNKIMKEEIDLL